MDIVLTANVFLIQKKDHKRNSEHPDATTETDLQVSAFILCISHRIS